MSTNEPLIILDPDKSATKKGSVIGNKQANNSNLDLSNLRITPAHAKRDFSDLSENDDDQSPKKLDDKQSPFTRKLESKLKSLTELEQKLRIYEHLIERFDSLEARVLTIEKIVSTENDLSNRIQSIENKIARLDSEYPNLNSSTVVPTNKWLKIATELSNQSSNGKPEATTFNIINEVASDIAERNKRKKSVVVFGVKCDHADDVSVQQKKDDEMAHLLLRSIGLGDIKISSCYRFRGEGPRPIRINFFSESDRDVVLKRSPMLRNTAHKDIYIRPDLTRSEQQMKKQLESIRATKNEELARQGKTDLMYVLNKSSNDLRLVKAKQVGQTTANSQSMSSNLWTTEVASNNNNNLPDIWNPNSSVSIDLSTQAADRSTLASKKSSKRNNDQKEVALPETESIQAVNSKNASRTTRSANKNKQTTVVETTQNSLHTPGNNKPGRKSYAELTKINQELLDRLATLEKSGKGKTSSGQPEYLIDMCESE